MFREPARDWTQDPPPGPAHERLNRVGYSQVDGSKPEVTVSQQRVNEGPIVYFGTGGASRGYCKNSRTLPNYFTDNNPTMWGTKFLGVLVVKPSDLLAIQPARIVLTTSFVAEVRHQLLSLGFSDNQIVLPAKHEWSLKPFEDPLVRQKTIKKIVNLQNTPNIAHPIVVVGGACLGLVRSGDLIPWDDDIDFRASEIDMAHIRNAMEEDDSFLRVEHGERFALHGLWKFLQTDQSASIQVGYSVTFYDTSSKRLADSFDRYRWSWPRNMFEDALAFHVGSAEINVPNPPEEYLLQVYGSDWRTPRVDFSVDDYGLDPESE